MLGPARRSGGTRKQIIGYPERNVNAALEQSRAARSIQLASHGSDELDEFSTRPTRVEKDLIARALTFDLFGNVDYRADDPESALSCARVK